MQTIFAKMLKLILTEFTPSSIQARSQWRKRGSFSALSAGAYPTTLLIMVTLSSPCFCVQERFLGMEIKYSFPCYGILRAIRWCTVLNALHLLLNKYVAEIQLPGNYIQLLSKPPSSTQSSAWLVIDDFPITSCTVHVKYKYSSSCEYWKLIWARWIIRVMLWPLGLYVLYYRSPRVLLVSM